MKFFIIIIGYNRDADWYENSAAIISNTLKIEETSYFAVDNKTGLYFKDKDILDYHNDEGNNFFEFTGYNDLIEIVSKSLGPSDLFLVINDTFFTNHAYFFWLQGIKKAIVQMGPREVIGDLRMTGNSLSPNLPFHASWLFLFKGVDLPTFQKCLKNTIVAAQLNEGNYRAVSQSTYALNIRSDCRVQLIEWLFHSSWLRGWPSGSSFDKMAVETRYRKGLCIFMEHFLGSSLMETGLVLIDLKKISTFAYLANLFDRLINLVQRIKNKCIDF